MMGHSKRGVAHTRCSVLLAHVELLGDSVLVQWVPSYVGV